jgi:hypothetical protein
MLTAKYSSTSKSVALMVNSPATALSAISVNPALVVGGQVATGTVTLTAPAGVGGATVSLFSSNKSVAAVPATVTVPQGSVSTPFPVTTGSVTVMSAVKLTAYYSGVNAKFNLTVNAPGSGGVVKWYGAGWTSRKTVTIHHTGVAGNLSNFPWLFSVTDANFKSVANGGLVGNSDGTDILFTAADGVTKLNYEMEHYDPTTGQVVAWIQIPALSSSADTVLYAYYGNPGAPDQSSKAAVWDTNFTGIWHLGGSTKLSLSDSSANGNNGINHGVAPAAGEIQGAGGFNGSSYVSLPSTVYQGYPTSGAISSFSETTEVWFKTSSAGAILGQDDQTPVGGNPSGWVPALYIDTNGKLRASFFWHNSTTFQIVTANSYNDNQWHQAVDVYANGLETLYVDGNPVGSQARQEYGYHSAYSYTLGTAATRLWSNANSSWFGWNGLLDEARTSNAARSSAWIQTEFLNQSTPVTSVALGQNQTQPVAAGG